MTERGNETDTRARTARHGTALHRPASPHPPPSSFDNLRQYMRDRSLRTRTARKSAHSSKRKSHVAPRPCRRCYCYSSSSASLERPGLLLVLQKAGHQQSAVLSFSSSSPMLSGQDISFRFLRRRPELVQQILVSSEQEKAALSSSLLSNHHVLVGKEDDTDLNHDDDDGDNDEESCDKQNCSCDYKDNVAPDAYTCLSKRLS